MGFNNPLKKIVGEAGIRGAVFENLWITRTLLIMQILPSCRILFDLFPEAPSFIMGVCGAGFHMGRRHFGQARRARSLQIAQASGALPRVCGSRAMSAV